jgi:hypothetical protein
MRRDNNNVISSALFRQFFMQQRVNAWIRSMRRDVFYYIRSCAACG